MLNRLFLLAFIILFKNCYSQPSHTANMFRGNAVHDSYVATNDPLIYDTKAWQFDAGSAVRSSPLVNNNTVYFGNANGDFFALDKKTGQVKWKFTSGKAIHSSAACQD